MMQLAGSESNGKLTNAFICCAVISCTRGRGAREPKNGRKTPRVRETGFSSQIVVSSGVVMDRYDSATNERNLTIVENKSSEYRENLSKLSINMVHSLENWSLLIVDEMIHMKEQMKFTRTLMTPEKTEEKPSK